MRGLSIPTWSVILLAPWTAGPAVRAMAPCEPGFAGDFDEDGDIDGDDLDILTGCATGPAAGPLGAGCERIDLDGDGDGDSTDFGIWQTFFTGPGDCPPLILEPPNGAMPGPLRTTYLHSGEFFESAVDLRIRGRGLEFVWARKYRSRIGPDTAMGHGWDFSYNRYIERVGPHIRVFDGNTRADLYRRQDNGTWTRRGFFNVLRRDRAGTYSLILPDTAKWAFNPLDDSPAAGKIAELVDRNGNALRFEYDALGRLRTIHDTLDTAAHNRDITIAYNKDGYIESVTDFIGRKVSYAYYQDGEAGGLAGDLKSVTTPAVVGTPTFNDFPLGKTTVYTYSKGFAEEALNHNLLTITDPKSQTYLMNSYGSGPDFDRVVRQTWGDPRDILDAVYVPLTPQAANHFAVSKAIINDRAGNVSEHFFDARHLCVVIRRYTGRADPDQPTTDTNNRPQNPLRPGDPIYFETGYQFNGDYLVTRITHPIGNQERFVYDETHPDPRSRGNLLAYHYPGPPADPIVERYEYDPAINHGTNFVTRHIDPRGHETTFGYDPQGNRTHITHRIPTIVEDFEYNPFGQLTAHILPDNGSGHRRRDEYTYYTSGPAMGYLQQATADAAPGGFHITTLYEYDAVGNATRIVDPSGRDTLHTYNALDQLVHTQSQEVLLPAGPIRYETLFYYDGNDNLVRQCRQNRDDQGHVVPDNGYMTQITEYDILDDPVRVCAESGRFDVPGNPPKLDCSGLPESEFVTNTYQYDDNRNLAGVRFGEAVEGRQPGNVVQYLYDERDLLFREIRGPAITDQSSARYDYDANGNMTISYTGLESPEPRITTYGYDDYDRHTSTTDLMGNETTYGYDDSFNITTVRRDGELNDVPGSAANLRLSETEYIHDDMDRLGRVKVKFFWPPDQSAIGDGLAETVITYNDDSRILTITDDNLHPTTTTYDTANRRRTVTDAKGNRLTFSYDPNGNLTSLISLEKSDFGNPDETFVTTYTYDGVDRLIQATDNIGNMGRYGYDSRGNMTRTVDPRGNVTRYAYDSLDRRIGTQRDLTDTGDGTGMVIGTMTTSQAWDDSHRLILQSDDNSNATTYIYDALDRLTTIDYADCTVEMLTYDVHDNVVHRTDPNGSLMEYTYDLLGRRIQADYVPVAGVAGDTTLEKLAYDGLSRLVLAQNDSSLITFEYDSLSNVRHHSQDGQITVSTHDGLGNTLACTYPGGRMVGYEYDELNRISAVRDGLGDLRASYDYIGPDRLERLAYRNRTAAVFTYDGAGNSSIPNPPGDFGVKQMIETRHFAVGGPTLDHRHYRWDRAANKTQRADVRVGGPEIKHLYGYDSLHRLQRGRKTRGFTPPIETLRDTQYVLDGVGNRLRVEENSVPGLYFRDRDQCEPADFQMNQYTRTPFDVRTYDANGNLISRTSGPATASSIPAMLEFDVHDRLVRHDTLAGVITAFSYDALGRRLSKTVSDGSGPPQTTQYLWGGNASGPVHVWQLLEETDPAAGPNRDFTAGRGLLAMHVGSKDYFYHHDDLGNLMALTDETGAVVERYEYGDFGEPEILSPAGEPRAASIVGNPYLFGSRRYDAETGLYYFQPRYLDPEAGRFITREPLAVWGDPHVTEKDGTRWDFRANNPWSDVDPGGRARSSKPKEIVVVGSKVKEVIREAGLRSDGELVQGVSDAPAHPPITQAGYVWMIDGAGSNRGIQQFVANIGTHSWSYDCWLCEQCGGTGHDPNCDDACNRCSIVAAIPGGGADDSTGVAPISTTFTLFKPDGTPVRAIVQPAIDDRRYRELVNTQSPAVATGPPPYPSTENPVVLSAGALRHVQGGMIMKTKHDTAKNAINNIRFGLSGSGGAGPSGSDKNPAYFTIEWAPETVRASYPAMGPNSFSAGVHPVRKGPATKKTAKKKATWTAITLKKGYISTTVLNDWIESARLGNGGYSFYEGWPCKWYVPELDSWSQPAWKKK